MFTNKILDEINSLNPETDYWRIIQLSIWYEFPWDYNRGLELALYKTFASPSISKVLFNSKEFELHTQKRYDDTDLLLSMIIDNGLHSEKGREAVSRINWIHSHFKISNEDFLYVLATFMFDSRNWINEYGYRKLTPNEILSGFKVWVDIGKQMNIQNIPETIEEYELFYNNYEKNHFTFHENNKVIAQATEDLMLGWYLPKFMFNWVRPALHAVMSPNLLEAFGYEKPNSFLIFLVRSLLKLRSKIASLNPIRKPLYRSKMISYKTYKNGFEMKDLGPEKLKKNCPYRAVMEEIKKSI